MKEMERRWARGEEERKQTEGRRDKGSGEKVGAAPAQC